MGCGCDDIRIGNGILMRTTGHQSGNVRHIHHQHTARLMGNLRKQLKINGSGIGRSTGNDQLGPVF